MSKLGKDVIFEVVLVLEQLMKSFLHARIVHAQPNSLRCYLPSGDSFKSTSMSCFKQY